MTSRWSAASTPRTGREVTSCRKFAALGLLVVGYNLSEEDALGVLEAARTHRKAAYALKRADNPMPWLIDEGKSETREIPYDQNTGGNLMANPNVDNDSTMQWNYPVEGQMATQNDPWSWNPLNVPEPNTLQNAMQASQRGQREVMDASSVAGLLSSNARDGGVSKAMGPLLKAVDALGKEYLAFLWNREEMEDRYGAGDAADLADSLCATSRTSARP